MHLILMSRHVKLIPHTQPLRKSDDRSHRRYLNALAAKLNIMLLYDLACAPDNRAGHERWFMTGDDFRDERHVMKALRRCGHTVEPFGLYNDLTPLLEKLNGMRPNVVFNMCESFSNSRHHEADVMSVLEMLGIAHTGASAEALNLCKDKALSKKIVSFHGISIPRFAVIMPPQTGLRPNHRNPTKPELFSDDAKDQLKTLKWPAICKPLDRDSSEGISKSSVVSNSASCLRHIAHLQKTFRRGVIVEEFIPGRELYIGMVELPGQKKLLVLPPRELYVGTGPGFVTWRAKWDKTYRSRHGIDSGRAKKIDVSVLHRLEQIAREAFHALELSGYARLDLRLRDNGDPVFIEANPNPSIRRGDDFAAAAHAAGIGYDDLIEGIVKTAMLRHNRNKQAA